MAAEPSAPLAFLVEDDQDIAMLVDFILRREGFEVERCADGRQAKARIGQAPVPDVAVLDVMLPYVDGFELIEMIRANPTWCAVPLLMLTAQSREEEIIRALDAGANDYVVKPFQPEVLKARLRRLRR